MKFGPGHLTDNFSLHELHVHVINILKHNQRWSRCIFHLYLTCQSSYYPSPPFFFIGQWPLWWNCAALFLKSLLPQGVGSQYFNWLRNGRKLRTIAKGNVFFYFMIVVFVFFISFHFKNNKRKQMCMFSTLKLKQTWFDE